LSPVTQHLSVALLLLVGGAASSPLVAQSGVPNLLGKPAGWEDQAPTEVQIIEGSVLRAAPVETAERLALLPRCQLLARETRGSWVRVRLGKLDGWIDLQGATLPYLGSVVEYQAPRDPAGVALQQALDILGGEAQPVPLGPFDFYHDVDDQKLLRLLGEIAPQVVAAFVDRYGLEVVEPQGVVVLFADERRYMQLKESQFNDIPFHSEGHAVPGLVAIKVGNRSRREVATTLIHELTHLIAWQVLGPDLPPWLNEGLADDLALSRIDREGRLNSDSFDQRSLRFGRNTAEILVKVVGSLSRAQPIRLVDFLSQDRRSFLAQPELHYALSALFVRFLLEDSLAGSAAAFKSYLQALRVEGITYPDFLRQQMRQPWGEIDVQFRLWARRTLARVQ